MASKIRATKKTVRKAPKDPFLQIYESNEPVISDLRKLLIDGQIKDEVEYNEIFKPTTKFTNLVKEIEENTRDNWEKLYELIDLQPTAGHKTVQDRKL